MRIIDYSLIANIRSLLIQLQTKYIATLDHIGAIDYILIVSWWIRSSKTNFRDKFKQVEGLFHFATDLDSTDTDEIATFLEEAIKVHFFAPVDLCFIH